ncbi:MFS transporter [Kiloniella laminariae]|uniref:MFS transporter n=1 Tax=Kiloniella laminariae TaxID=454162 RepID=A0ABT4LER7_9PROT|nr:MFS transporter [Kiloniella laminariae]MCZ4279595.1 MFS transporter [Kiloniella laminariae]
MFTFPIFLLTASVAIVGSNSLLLSPIAGAVARSFPGTDAADVLLASAAYGLSTAASALLLAPLIDRIGGKRALLLALSLLTCALIITATAPTLWVLCAGQALAGIAAGVTLPAAYGLSAELAPQGRESETLGIVLTGWTISLVFGVSLSALMTDLLHWRAAFGVIAFIALMIVTSLYLTGRRDRLGESPGWGAAVRRDSATSPLTALRVPGIIRALMVCAAFMTAFYGLYSYLGVHLQTVLGKSTSVSGLATVAYGVGFGAAVVLDRFIDRHGAARIAVFVFTAVAMTYGSMALAAKDFFSLVVMCFVWGGVNHLGLNLIVGRLTALDPTQRGAIMGLYSAVAYLCVFVGAIGFRPLYELSGLSACALLAALCILPAIIDGMKRRRETGKITANPA